jgi:hypothetical protein
MATLRSLASRISALFRRRELDDRVDEELEFHIRMETEENIRRGMDPVAPGSGPPQDRQHDSGV